MSSVKVILKQVRNHEWQIFAPLGHTIGPIFRGDKFAALEWARAWISSFHNWTVDLDTDDEDMHKM